MGGAAKRLLARRLLDGWLGWHFGGVATCLEALLPVGCSCASRRCETGGLAGHGLRLLVAAGAAIGGPSRHVHAVTSEQGWVACAAKGV